MAFGVRHSRALVLGASAFSFALMSSGGSVRADARSGGRHARSEQKKQKQAKRQQAKPQQDAQAAPVMNARAQIGAAPVQSLDTITVGGFEDRGARDRRAGSRQRGDAGADPGPAAEPARAVILYNIPGVSVQERGDDPSTVDQHPRPAGFRPRRRRRRRRAAELPAHRPQRQRLVLPRPRAGRRRRRGARPDRQHLRLRRDRRRGRRSAPRTSTTSCARASAGAST